MPASLTKFQKIQPNYVELDGWTEDISKAQTFEELPVNAQKYIQFIEDDLKVKISWIGNGPKREEMIHREAVKKPSEPKKAPSGLPRGRPSKAAVAESKK